MLAVTEQPGEFILVGDTLVGVNRARAGKLQFVIDGPAKVLRSEVIKRELKKRGYTYLSAGKWLGTGKAVVDTLAALRESGLAGT